MCYFVSLPTRMTKRYAHKGRGKELDVQQDVTVAWGVSTTIWESIYNYLWVAFKKYLIQTEFFCQNQSTTRCQHFHHLYWCRQWNSLCKGSHDKTIVITYNTAQSSQLSILEHCSVEVDFQLARWRRGPAAGRYRPHRWLGNRQATLKLLQAVWGQTN